MADLDAARLRALEDRAAIADLIARYGPLADAGDAAGVAALWTDDGVYAVDGLPEGRGRAAIAAFIEGEMHRDLMARGCAHLLGPATITLEGDGATALCHSVVLARSDEAWAAVRVAANRWELARTADGWRVVSRDNALLNGSQRARALFGTGAA